MKLDDRDIAILRILSTEGRITKAALAEISLRALGPNVTVFVAAELADHTAAISDRSRRPSNAMMRSSPAGRSAAGSTTSCRS